MKVLSKVAASFFALGLCAATHAATIDGVNWDDLGQVDFNSSNGRTIFSTDQRFVGGSIDLTNNLGNIYRPDVYYNVPGFSVGSNIGANNWFTAMGSITSFGNTTSNAPLTYVISGQLIGPSAISTSPANAKVQTAFVAGTLTLDIFSGGASAYNASIGCNFTTLVGCQTPANAATSGVLFMHAVGTASTANPAQTVALLTVENTQSNAQTFPGTSVTTAALNLQLSTGYFNVLSGDAASYFDSGLIDINFPLTDISATSSGPVQSGSARLVQFGPLFTANSTPEPGTLALMGLALAGVGALSAKRRRAAQPV